MSHRKGGGIAEPVGGGGIVYEDGNDDMDKKYSISQERYAKIQDAFKDLTMAMHALHAIVENTYEPSVAIRPNPDTLTKPNRAET